MSIHKKIEGISKIPTLPEIAVTIMKKTSEDSRTSISEISKLIQKDTALTTNVLKLVNSPFYNVGRSIGNLQQALVILGTNEIRNLVISISLYSIYQSKNINAGFKRIWKHSMNTALVSQYISQTIGHKSERLFIASLLHDIGWLLLWQNYKELVEEYEEKCQNNMKLNSPLELKLFGMTHEQIGSYAATLWGLPSDILELIESHHKGEIKKDLYKDLCILQLANYYTDVHSLAEDRRLSIDELDMAYYPLIDEFSSKYEKFDFLNDESEFYVEIFQLLESSGSTGSTYH